MLQPAKLTGSENLTQPTELLLEVASAPGKTLTIFGENRTEDADMLRLFGFVRVTRDEYAPTGDGNVARTMELVATASGFKFASRITADK